MAMAEDIETLGDLTSQSLVPESAEGVATIHSRQIGTAAGIQAVPSILAAVDTSLRWEPAVFDGADLALGTRIGVISGQARSLFISERIVLNILGRLSGIASLTKKYVEAVKGTSARIYDTRKTILGWRRLEKYAVRCGGGMNHRTGLYDAILIKDNHLAFGAGTEESPRFSPAEAVTYAKEFLNRHFDDVPIVEIEVDTLEQLKEILPTEPDIVLLDNMTPAQLTDAVRMRNILNPKVELEASGGITLQTVSSVAKTGVERISVGALTHSAGSLDLGLDWGTN